ncbi:MAG: YwiC-like family protein [Pyrinomonadaceae bacterium]
MIVATANVPGELVCPLSFVLEITLEGFAQLIVETNAASVQLNTVRLRTVALPVEHGGWGLLFEPIVLGLVIAPSWAGLFLSIAATGAFLTRHPLRLVVADLRRGRRFARTAKAEQFVLLYGTVAALSFIMALETAVSFAFILPVLLAVPFALIQIGYDAVARGRSLIPELAGSVALAATASAIALAAGWPRPAALALWVLLAARVVPAIIYVRARIAVLHRQRPARLMTVLLHVVALAAVSVLVWNALLPRLAAFALLMLFARAVFGMVGWDRAASAKAIGFREIGFGLVMVALVAAGHYFSF